MTATTEPPAPKVRVRERVRPAPTEAAPAKTGKRWQWDDEYRKQHNAKRKEKYRNDPEVRAKIQAQARERKRRDDLEKNLEAHVGKAGDFGAVRHVEGLGDIHCFTVDDLGDFIVYHPMVIRRWIHPDAGQLPEPILQARPLMGDKIAGADLVPVYSAAEAEAILACMIEHQKSYRYFRTSHIDTIDALARAIEKVRHG